MLLAGCSSLPGARTAYPEDTQEQPPHQPTLTAAPVAAAEDGNGPSLKEDSAGGLPSMRDCLKLYGKAGLGPGLRDLLQGEASDELWQCAARAATSDCAYRAEVAYELLLTGPETIDTALPGYQAFARTTELQYGEPETFPAPDGWEVLDATPSPTGRYVAARLADGGVGWWALDGSGGERYDAAGFDLAWHPTEERFTFVSDTNSVHLVQPAGPVTHQVFESPVGVPVRYPYWALPEGAFADEYSRDPDSVLALADPEGAPRGLVLRPATGTWAEFDAKRILLPGGEVTFPPWLTQPWASRSGDYLHYDPEGRRLLQADAGSPYVLYHVPADAEPVSLTWSPEGGFLVVVERRDGRLTAQLLRSSQDYMGHHFSVPLENQHIAISDDGVTSFTASDQRVRALNHLTGAETTWSLGGEVRSVRLRRSQLFVALADRVVVVPFTEASCSGR